MHSSPREASVKLTRWQYFIKCLYHNAAATTEFTYDRRVYIKDDTLQAIDQKNQRLNLVMVLLLVVLYLLTSRFQMVWLVVGYLMAVVILQAVRFMNLPRDITAHLRDSGRMERL